MASPIPGSGIVPRMPRQPGEEMIYIPDPNPRATKKPKAKVQPIVPKQKRNTGMAAQPFPAPAPYTPIKQTKAVEKVYKTY